jgi:beta-glucosidase
MAPIIGNVRPANSNSRWQRWLTEWLQYLLYWAYISHLQHYMDFIGVNYYFTYYLDGLLRDKSPHEPLNDLGWYMELSGIEQVLVETWHRYHKPLLVTENGLADAADAHRTWWLQETMPALQRAIAKGVDLRGYLHWSLLDNFEWADGWWPKFGLVAVDRTTMKRSIRPSAKWLAGYIAAQTSKDV